MSTQTKFLIGFFVLLCGLLQGIGVHAFSNLFPSFVGPETVEVAASLVTIDEARGDSDPTFQCASATHDDANSDFLEDEESKEAVDVVDCGYGHNFPLHITQPSADGLFVNARYSRSGGASLERPPR